MKKVNEVNNLKEVVEFMLVPFAVIGFFTIVFCVLNLIALLIVSFIGG